MLYVMTRGQRVKSFYTHFIFFCYIDKSTPQWYTGWEVQGLSPSISFLLFFIERNFWILKRNNSILCALFCCFSKGLVNIKDLAAYWLSSPVAITFLYILWSLDSCERYTSLIGHSIKSLINCLWIYFFM